MLFLLAFANTSAVMLLQVGPFVVGKYTSFMMVEIFGSYDHEQYIC
jgi:hypothetical protein